VTILRTEQKKEKNSIPNDSGKRYKYLNINTPLKSDDFKSLSNDRKQNILNSFLREIERDEIKTDKEFNKKERVIVNPKGDYGLNRTVFDDEIFIPKHLRKPLKVKNV